MPMLQGGAHNREGRTTSALLTCNLVEAFYEARIGFRHVRLQEIEELGTQAQQSDARDASSTPSREDGKSCSPDDMSTTASLTECTSIRDSLTETSDLTPRVGSWWSEACFSSLKGLETAAAITQLVEVRVVRHAECGSTQKRNGTCPWSFGKSLSLYKDIGMSGTGGTYVAWWLNLKSASLLSFSEVMDPRRLEYCLSADPLMQRLKCILRPIKTKLPFPVNGVKEADTVASFFGMRHASCTRKKVTDNDEVVCVQIDLFSNWLVRMAINHVGFQKGNVVEMLLIDWPGQAVLAAHQINVNEEFLQLLA